MVFGWGKKKSTNETAESTKHERQISFSDINPILKENETQLLGKILEQAKSIGAQIDIERKNIIQTMSLFENDDLKAEDVDKSLKVLIERGKKAVVLGLKRETAVNLSNPETFPNLANLNLQTGQMLKRIGDTLGINSRIMHVFARKYADKLKEDLADMAKNKKVLQALVDEYTNFEATSKNILESVEKIKKSKKDIDDKNHRLIELQKEVEDHKNTINNLEQDIRNLKSTNEYQEFLNVKKDIESLMPEKNAIKNEINLQFSKISRPLGKYSYISSLEKPLKIIMDRLVAEPSDVITSENKNAIIEILQATVKSVVAGNVSVKDSQKAAEQIEETISRLDEFINLKHNLAKKMNEFESKFVIFNIRDLEEKEKKVTRTKENIIQSESSLKILEKEISEESKRPPKIAHDVEAKINEISKTRITLKI
jgi:DNA repair exonuclease SbcCD ATPase subunit